MRKAAYLLLFAWTLFSANLLERGIAYYLKGDLKKAGALWEKYFASRQDPIARGFMKLAQGDFAEASVAFNSYRKESRYAYYGKYEWLKYLGLSLAVSDIGYFQREWFAARAKEFAPNSPIITFVQGVYDLEMGNLSRAEKRLSLATRKLRDGVFSYFLGLLYIQRGDVEKAEEIFKQYKFTDLGLELAKACRERGDDIKAWEILKSLPRTPEVVENMVDLAFSLERDYMVKEVQGYITDQQLLQETEAYFLVKKGKCGKAKKILRKLSLFRPTDHHIWDWMAKCEKKRENRLKYLYLSFFNGGDVPNLFGVKRQRVVKIDRAKWLGEDNLVVLGRLSGKEPYGLYIWNPEAQTHYRIPIRAEVEDFFPQQDGETLVISAVNRVRGRRSFYVWRVGERRPRKTVVLRLTGEEFVGEVRDGILLIYSRDFLTLPFRSPFKKIVNIRDYYPLYSSHFPYFFVQYDLKRRRVKKLRSIQSLPFVPDAIEKYLLLKGIYARNPDFRSIIDSHSSVASETIRIDFLSPQNAVVYRVSNGKKYLLGYIKEGEWRNLRIREDDEDYEFITWIYEFNGFVCRNKDGRGYIYWVGRRKFKKLEKKMGDAVYLQGGLYFLAGDDEGKKRLYFYDITKDDTEKLTDYLWTSAGKIRNLLALKDPTTTVYVLRGRSIYPVYVEDNKIILFTPSYSKAFLYLPMQKDVYLVNLK